MTVAAILEAKGRGVVTTTAGVTIAEAVELLVHHKIGALVVVDKSVHVVGIVSERDVVRCVARGSADALAQSVEFLMTRPVMTCTEDETINEVMTRMTRGRFRHLPVVANGRLTGIVSIGDVVKARIEQVEREADEMRAYIAVA